MNPTITDEMVEAAARALAEHIYEKIGAPELVHDPKYAGQYVFAGIDLKQAARAALSAVIVEGTIPGGGAGGQATFSAEEANRTTVPGHGGGGKDDDFHLSRQTGTGK